LLALVELVVVIFLEVVEAIYKDFKEEVQLYLEPRQPIETIQTVVEALRHKEVKVDLVMMLETIFQEHQEALYREEMEIVVQPMAKVVVEAIMEAVEETVMQMEAVSIQETALEAVDHRI
jgi:hypothetical protein